MNSVIKYGLMDQGWIKFNKSWEQFEKNGLIAPGVLVKMKNGERYLIGDINELRGVCDDCTAFGKTAIVVAYKVIWKEK